MATPSPSPPTPTIEETLPRTPIPTHRQERSVSNTNLYLVTFVATLFLLLFVSCGIVLRSYLLRRRYQRQINFALASGAVITPHAPGSKRKRLGVRPRLYETWIAPLSGEGYDTSKGSTSSQDVTEKLIFETDDQPKARWRDMLPLTVQTVIVKRRIRDPVTLLSPGSLTISTTAAATASPPTPFPPCAAGLSTSTRPLLSIVTPPSNLPPSSWNVQRGIPTSPPTPRSSQPQVQFADRLRLGLVSFPSAPENQNHTPRSRRNSLLTMLTPASPTPDTPTPRQRRGSTGSIIGGRDRRDSATWRTIISPNPSLPMAPLPSAVSTGEEDWTNEENESRGRSAFNRWNPFTARREGTNGGSELSGTPSGGKKRGRAASKSRLRTEMLQISVLVEMPSVKTSRLYGDTKGPYPSSQSQGSVGTGDSITHLLPLPNAGFAPDAEGISDDESDSDSDDGEKEPGALPDLVLGVTRLVYNHNGPTKAEFTPITPIVPAAPAVPVEVLFGQSTEATPSASRMV